MDEDKKHYSKIPKELRREIIKLIIDEKVPINDVAAKYGLLASTCKSIVNTFMKEGRVGKKESRIRKLKKVIVTYNIILNPINPAFSQIQSNTNVVDCIEPSMKSRKSTEEYGKKEDMDDFNIFLQSWAHSIQLSMHFMNQQN